MAEEEFDSFDNLDDLDWSDVEDELKANRDEIIASADDSDEAPPEAAAAPAGGADAATKVLSGKGDLDIDFLLDVQLEISVEVGRAQVYIEDLLQFDQGSVMELNTLVGQPLDMRVNSKLIARGEVVVINDKFAVRITSIVSPDDRFSSLQ